MEFLHDLCFFLTIFLIMPTKFSPVCGPSSEVIHMTKDQRKKIDSLRNQGMGYKRIAGMLGLSENTVKSYLRRNATQDMPERMSHQTEELPQSTAETHNCLQCGQPVRQNPGRKEKKFCSDKCRNAWWNSHLDLVKRKAVYSFTCPVCRKEFTAYGKSNRKYCSHVCYIRGRFGGAECV